MTGDITKSFDFSIVVSPESLKSIDKFISSKYEIRKYTVETIDGASFLAKDISEILEYTNPRARRIVKIEITGRNGDWWCDKPSICFSLSEAFGFRNSVIYTLKNESEKDLDFSVKKLHELVFPMKASYSWMLNKKFNFVLDVLGIAFPITGFVLTRYLAYEKSFAIWLGVIVLIFWGLRWLVHILFPRAVFLIGQQVLWHEKIERRRIFVFEKTFWALILSFVVSCVFFFFK